MSWQNQRIHNNWQPSRKRWKTPRMVLDRVSDHIDPHIADKNTTKDMWDVIVKLYQDPSENHKMILKEKLMIVKMQKGEDVIKKLNDVHPYLVYKFCKCL